MKRPLLIFGAIVAVLTIGTRFFGPKQHTGIVDHSIYWPEFDPSGWQYPAPCNVHLKDGMCCAVFGRCPEYVAGAEYTFDTCQPCKDWRGGGL